VGSWVDGGIGYGGTVGTNGVAGVMGLNFRYADSYYSVFSSTVSSENTIYAPGLFTQWAYNKEHSRDVGFLYGSIGDLGAGYYTYGVGLAYAQGRTSNDSAIYTTLGIPFQTQIVWTPFKYVGLGLKAFAALNGHVRQSDAGVAIELSLGKFA
jgi:hypothetical protein